MKCNGKVVLFQSDAELKFDKGLNAYKKGDIEQAILYLQRACLEDKNNFIYKLKLAAFLIEYKEWARAVNILNELDAIDVATDECDLLRTICYVNMGDVARAKSYADVYMAAMLEADSLKNGGGVRLEKEKKVHILLQLALNYIERDTIEDLNRAVAFLRQIIRLDQEQYYMYNYLAAAFLNIQEYNLASECLDQVLMNDPYNIPALCYYAQIHYETEQIESLNQLLLRIRNLVPINEYDRLKLGYTLAKLGRYYDALIILNGITTPAFRLRKSYLFWMNECLCHMNCNSTFQSYRNRLKLQFVKGF